MDERSVELHDRVERAATLVREALGEPMAQHAAALSAIARTVSRIHPSIHSEGQLFALAGVCRFFQLPHQDHAQALPAAQLLAQRALVLGRPHERLSALLAQGHIYADLDNALEAIECLADARQLAQELGLLRAEVAAMTEAAQTLWAAGEPSAAHSVARSSLALAEVSEDVDGQATCWTLMGHWHAYAMEPELGLDAVERARARLERGSDAALCASVDWLEVLLRVALGRLDDIDGLLEALQRDARRSGSLVATLSQSAALAAVEMARGSRSGSVRLNLALEKARRTPSALANVLMAAVIATQASSDMNEADRFRTELAALQAARRTTAQLQATLVRGSLVGFGARGRAHDVEVYERRLAVAVSRLLRGRDYDEPLEKCAVSASSGQPRRARPV